MGNGEKTERKLSSYKPQLWFTTYCNKDLIKKIVKANKFPNQSRTERSCYNALDREGIIKRGTWVEPGQILILKKRIIQSPFTVREFLQTGTKNERPFQIRDVSLRVPSTVSGRI